MSEQVKRYSFGEFAEQYTHPVGPGSYVKASDYDALHAEAEALQRQVTELTNQRDAILLQARCWAGEAKAQQAITKAVCEALGGVPNWGPIAAGVEALRDQLDAARGLLELCHAEMNEPADSGFEMSPRRRVGNFLTATPAPEVQQMARNALSAENQRLVPPEPIIAPPHPFDKPSLLKDCNVTYSNSSRPLAEQGERQEAQVMARVHHNPDHPEPVRAVLNSIGRQLPDNAPLYAEPQPGPDVRGLVEALAAAAADLEDWRMSFPDANATVTDSLLARIDSLIAAHRQAQQGDSHES